MHSRYVEDEKKKFYNKLNSRYNTMIRQGSKIKSDIIDVFILRSKKKTFMNVDEAKGILSYIHEYNITIQHRKKMGIGFKICIDFLDTYIHLYKVSMYIFHVVCI